jgi:hypothetical protein
MQKENMKKTWKTCKIGTPKKQVKKQQTIAIVHTSSVAQKIS